METILLLAVTTGMRKGEMLALRWTDIDIKRLTLSVNRTLLRLSVYGFIENDPKTKRSRRKLVLPDVVVEALKKHQIEQDNARLKAGSKWQNKGLVFPNSLGGFLNSDVVRTRLNKLLDQAGLPHVRFHDLRHSAATILLSLGVHPKVVQEILGHRSITMTMELYSHFLPTMQNDAMRAMNNWFE